MEMLASRDKYLLLGNVRFKCQPVATAALLRKIFYVCSSVMRLCVQAKESGLLLLSKK